MYGPAKGSALVVRSWNTAAEQLTGVTRDEAVGRHCWELLGGIGPDGDMVCHAGCSNARLAQEGFPVPHHTLLVQGSEGRRRVDMVTIRLEDGRLVHLLVPPRRPRRGVTTMTPREQEVLGLMSDGVSARAMTARLGVTEATVRTYIRAVLRELDAHSQLEAVAKARRVGLL